MKKPFRIILLSTIIIILILMINIVFGKTIAMIIANYWFRVGEYDKAQSICEDIMVDLPTNPNVLNNLSLCLYQQGQTQKGIDFFQKVIKKLEPVKTAKHRNAGIFYYNYGNSFYRTAVKNPDPTQALKLYSEALDNYKKALLVNSMDQDAKYNYELAMLHINELQKQPPPNQTQQQETQTMLNNDTPEQYKRKLVENPPNGKDW